MPGRESHHSHTSSAEVKYMCSYISITPSYVFMTWCLFTITLISYLCLGLPSGLFPSVFQLRFCVTFRTILRFRWVVLTTSSHSKKKHRFIPNIQGEHKRTLHFQNDTERKCGVLRTSHLHQSIENSQSFVHTSHRLDMCSASHTADVQTIIQIVPNFVQCP
jgi:hypothetical protein